MNVAWQIARRGAWEGLEAGVDSGREASGTTTTTTPGHAVTSMIEMTYCIVERDVTAYSRQRHTRKRKKSLLLRKLMVLRPL